MELMVDKTTGKINPEVLNEKVLSTIVEFGISSDRLKEILVAVRDVSTQINTVFSLDLISRLDSDGTMPNLAIAEEVGFSPRPNTKTNVGLGRPLFEEA
jgi:hypothetical protein